MKYIKNAVTLADGTECILRSPVPGDAAEVRRFLRAVCGETDYLLRYPDEITLTLEEERNFLRGRSESARELCLLAFIDRKLVAMADFNPVGTAEKLRHRAIFTITVRRDYWSCGIGSLLAQELIAACRDAGFSQLELSVFANNDRAIRLYTRLGFSVWGRIPSAFRLRDGSVQEELHMGLLL